MKLLLLHIPFSAPHTPATRKYIRSAYSFAQLQAMVDDHSYAGKLRKVEADKVLKEHLVFCSSTLK